MPKHLWTVLCKRTVLDRYTNTVSMFQVLDELKAPLSELEMPATVPLEWSLTTLWMREDLTISEEFATRVDIISPKGKTLGGSEAPVDMSAHKRHRMITNQDRLSIDGPGIYLFRIEYKAKNGRWVRAAEVPLELTDSTEADGKAKPPTNGRGKGPPKKRPRRKK